jgi:hypothetical protein
MDSGRFACGRVMGRWPTTFKGAKSGFFAGLLDWTGAEPPTFENIAGSNILIEGGVHIKAILNFGGAILGNRPLALDRLEPGFYIEYPDNKTAHVWKGMDMVRVATAADIRQFKPLNIFGFAFMQSYANEHLNQTTQ